MNNTIKRNRANFDIFVDVVDWARAAAEANPEGLLLKQIMASLKNDLGANVAESTIRSACAKAGLKVRTARQAPNPNSKGHASDDTRFLAALVADVSRGVRDGWSPAEQMRLSQIRAGKKAA